MPYQARLPGGAFSTASSTAPPHSPPRPRPCPKRHSPSSAGASTPMLSYVGSTPITTVDTPIVSSAATRVGPRPPEQRRRAPPDAAGRRLRAHHPRRPAHREQRRREGPPAADPIGEVPGEDRAARTREKGEAERGERRQRRRGGVGRWKEPLR